MDKEDFKEVMRIISSVFLAIMGIVLIIYIVAALKYTMDEGAIVEYRLTTDQDSKGFIIIEVVEDGVDHHIYLPHATREETLETLERLNKNLKK